jgi:hypothetical protein
MTHLSRLLGRPGLSASAAGLAAIVVICSNEVLSADPPIGQEVAARDRLADGQEFELGILKLLKAGEQFFEANWTIQEGGGRPLTKGTGNPLSDPAAPLLFPRNFNRISAPDANSCAGCHNAPLGITGGGGDFVTNVFVLGQRFDDATFDHDDLVPTKGAVDEVGNFVLAGNIGNSRATLGMFGSGYIEMLSRQITVDLQAIRDTIAPGQSKPLVSKAISFGTLARDAAGAWDTSAVLGLPAPSLASTGPENPPNLIVRPFHQAGAVISVRQFTNNAMNHHHGIQPTERFGTGTDPDGDSFMNEMSRAEVTATSLFQAAMGIPGRVIPRDDTIEKAVLNGEVKFRAVGCDSCHVPWVPLTQQGWVFTEPNPFNPPGNLQPGQAPTLSMNLNSLLLPGVRLKAMGGVTQVPAFTDLKLHDMCAGPDDPNAEPLDMHQPPGSPPFFAGNCRFITRKLWGVANEPPYFHHGKYTTLREAVLAHAGEAMESRTAFEALPSYDRDSIIEFLKTLQVLPPWVKFRVVDENYLPRSWGGEF